MQICHDWALQTGTQPVTCHTQAQGVAPVRFESEHLRRVLINLLDNAHRYASKEADAIQEATGQSEGRRAFVSVWSDGHPMDQSVERHLFEPFFSSESRSSGLGLYICRELCERHGATIIHRRSTRYRGGDAIEGNEFLVSFHDPFTRESGHPLVHNTLPIL